MRIWIDGYEANIPQRLGSSQVAFELLRNLEKIDLENDYTILLPNLPMDDLPVQRDGWKYQILKPKRLWTRIALPLTLYLTRNKPDLIFSPTHYIPRFSPVKRVVTIFDLSFIHFPKLFPKKDLWQLTSWTKFSALNADHIITISKFSKADIRKEYDIEDKKITVAYPGYSSELFPPIKDEERIGKVLGKYGVGNDYIIYIGTIQPRKNLGRLIEAFVRLIDNPLLGDSLTRANEPTSKRVNDLKLVIVGKTIGEGRGGWMFEEILKLPKKLGIDKKVIFTGFIPSEDLPYLVSGALAFILPSLWEGFGIPVVDAMASGVPVIASKVSSLPEVVGRAGLLVDPLSVDQIEQALGLAIFDKKLRTKLSKLGIAQAKKFSWEKMAREVLKVFQEVASD